jgi:hypothetical protein
LIKFEGDHNSARPQFYYDSVSIFFYNGLNPPQFPSACSNKLDKYHNLSYLKAGAGTNEVYFSLFLKNRVLYFPPCLIRSPVIPNIYLNFRAYCMRSSMVYEQLALMQAVHQQLRLILEMV